MARTALAGIAMLAVAACGDQPTAPGRMATVTSLRYQRERPFDPAVTSQASLQMYSPIPGDPRNRTYIISCLLEPRGNNLFSCPENVTREVPVNEDCSIQVYDPAVTTNEFHMVATSVFVNNQRVPRVEVFSNGVEIARFRVTPGGQIR
jgi:hypothetical protein